MRMLFNTDKTAKKTAAKTYNASHGPSRIGNYRWYFMGQRGLKYDVRGVNGKVLIPAGTKYVGIAFGQSHLTRVDENGNTVKLNVYRTRVRTADGRWTVKLYHA